MGRRRGPADERRAAILAAAEQVFTDRGYSAASIRAIAAEAGVSSALLYWFFPSKADLFAAVLLARIDAQETLAFPPEFLDLPPTTLVPLMAQAFLNIWSEGGQFRMMRLVMRDADQAPELTAALSGAITSRVLGPLRTYFTHQMELGRIRPMDPDFLVQTLVGTLIGVVLRRELLQEPASRSWDLAAYIATALDVVLHGALVPPDGAAPIPPITLPTTQPAAPSRAAHHITVED
jgi:AcrR family transcriptional regulator